MVSGREDLPLENIGVLGTIKFGPKHERNKNTINVLCIHLSITFYKTYMH